MKISQNDLSVDNRRVNHNSITATFRRDRKAVDDHNVGNRRSLQGKRRGERRNTGKTNKVTVRPDEPEGNSTERVI